MSTNFMPFKKISRTSEEGYCRKKEIDVCVEITTNQQRDSVVCVTGVKALVTRLCNQTNCQFHDCPENSQHTPSYTPPKEPYFQPK